MCGLVAILGESFDPQVLSEMSEALAHRGPDGKRSQVVDGVALAHNRLAITEVGLLGDQPMTSRDGHLTICFNGEIYNQHELRAILKEEGVTFKTTSSDTECILEAVAQWGIERAVRELRGMFAFILVDREEKKVFAVRDHTGIKPLYTVEVKGTRYIASEIKAFYEIPDFDPVINSENLRLQLCFRSLPAPLTLLKGVEQIPPATLIGYSLLGQKISASRYWAPGMCKTLPLNTHAKLGNFLSDVVRQQLISERPLGVFMSGGVDSSLVASFVADSLELEHVYTIKYDTSTEFDESERAEIIGRGLEVNVRKVELKSSETLAATRKALAVLDEPNFAPVCLPLLSLAEQASADGVPVILTGEGADEIFFGYKTWLFVYNLERYRSLVGDKIFSFTLRLLALITPRHRLKSRLLELAERGKISGAPLFWGGAWELSVDEVNSILEETENPLSVGEVYSKCIEPIWEEFKKHHKETDRLRWAAFCDLRFRLPSLMLPRVDKICMSAGIEARVPFLDHILIDRWLANSEKLLLEELKKQKRTLKHLQKLRFPNLRLAKRKIGFQAPVDQLLPHELQDMGEQINKFCSEQEVFHPLKLRTYLNTAAPRTRLFFYGLAVWSEATLDRTKGE